MALYEDRQKFVDLASRVQNLDHSSTQYQTAKKNLFDFIKTSGFHPNNEQMYDLFQAGIDINSEVGLPSGSPSETPYPKEYLNPNPTPTDPTPVTPQQPDLQPNSWAQTGMIAGVPLLTSITLGVPVEDSVAALFGQDKDTFQSFYDSQPPEMKKSIDVLKSNLNTIQSNYNVRQKLVDDLTANYPQIVAQNLKQAADTYGPQLDDVAKQFMSRTADQLAAKFNARGGFSSGAFNEGLSNSAADIASQRQSYLSDVANKMYSQRYSEATAGLNFQKMMLGQADQNIFNAGQNTLDRQANVDQANKKLDFLAKNQQDKNNANLFGSIGSLVGTGVGAYFGGIPGATIGNKVGGNAGNFFSDIGDSFSSPFG